MKLDFREVFRNWRKLVPLALTIVTALAVGCIGYTYRHYSRIIDERLSHESVAGTVSLYAAPHLIAPGETITADELCAELRRAGYVQGTSGRTGSFTRSGDILEVEPGEESFFRKEGARIEFKKGKIASIKSRGASTEMAQYGIEPQLLTNRSAGQQERRRPVRFEQIPTVLRQAILSAEDKNFFQHPGFDLRRVLKSAYTDLRSGRKEQGGSTLTMQLARSLWLDSRKNWRRKVNELFLTLVLEHKLSKQEIFTHYVNQIYLGQQQGTAVFGFAEAARVYLRKDLDQLTVADAALLAGMVQRPVYLNPFHYPENAIARRNLVLGLMKQNGYLSDGACNAARSAPMVVREADPGEEAPYFLGFAEQELDTSELAAKPVAKLYTTLDLGLQRIAEEAVRSGLSSIDRRLRVKAQKPQAALIALDPHTGEVRALVGGRDYSASQLNHALAARQPGSVFKPIVYAAALSDAGLNPDSMLEDEPTSFKFEGQVYTPANHNDVYLGTVSMRTALAHSLNIPAVLAAQKATFRRVAEYAYSAGLNHKIQATPAIALGAYEVTPLEMAAAYTVFANGGVFVPARFVSRVALRNGESFDAPEPAPHRVFSEGVAFQMQEMLTEVIRSGTAAGSRGLSVEAAGKTGTSRDGWFIGFTGDLLCAVWVGFDDNHDLKLEGAESALPIWTEFMRRATVLPGYTRPLNRAVPPGLVRLVVDSETGLLAGPLCPATHIIYVSPGSQYPAPCKHEEDQTGESDREQDRQ